MTIPLCTFKTTSSPFTKDNFPMTWDENAFLTYTLFFFQNLQEINMSYYFSTSAEINADFKRFCDKYKLSTLMTTEEPRVHAIALSICSKIQFLYPSKFGQSQTVRLRGTGICMSISI